MKTTIVDVYKFALSEKCPFGLSEAIISTTEKLFYNLDVKTQKELTEFKMGKIRKVFISQPMRDKTDEEILEKRSRLKELLIQNFGDTPIEILDTFFTNLEIPDDVKHPEIYRFSKTIEMLSKADTLFMAEDWERYRGCIFERDIFRAYYKVSGGIYDEYELKMYANKEELNNE